MNAIKTRDSQCPSSVVLENEHSSLGVTLCNILDTDVGDISKDSDKLNIFGNECKVTFNINCQTLPSS